MGPKKKAINKNDSEDEKSSPKKKPRVKDNITKEETALFQKDDILFSHLDEHKVYVRIVSWNVAGLRGTLKNKPDILENLILNCNPDILCLQETKLQEDHVKEFVNILNGYQGYWSCSKEKKGYSGTTGLVSTQPIKTNQKTILSLWGKVKGTQNQSEESKESVESATSSPPEMTISSSEVTKPFNVLDVKYEIGVETLDGEGRIITVEFSKFFLVACYVPNSGQDLKRLDFRIQQWDPALRSYLNKLHETKPVILTGDLNVGHLDHDIYNVTAKHIPKSAGLTPQERSSFSELLASGYSDVFRYFHPDAKGHFTYWSQRAGNRPFNKGLRLDYFVCSNDMLPAHPNNNIITELDDNDERSVVVDSYMLTDFGVGCSDHCPILLLLKV